MVDLHAIVEQPGRTSARPLWQRWRSQGWNRNRLKGELSHLTDEQCRQLRLLCKARCTEMGIPPNRAKPRDKAKDQDVKPPRSVAEAASHIQGKMESVHKGDVWTINSTGRITTLDELLKTAGVDRDRWYVQSWRANAYEAQRSGGGIVQLWQVKASLQENPQWMWQPVQPRVHYPRVELQEPAEITLVVPDSQNGYRWQENHKVLQPLHDRRAWDLVIQVAELLRPSRILLLGDMVDFAEGSKRWPVGPDLRATTQPTIEELYWWLHRLRQIAPQASIQYLEGNHEDRIDRALISTMPELSGLRPATDSEPLVTWKRLLALDSLGIDYVGPYGTSITLAPDCEANHGTVVAQGGGATAARILKGAHISQIYGHIHRREYGCKTVYGPHGRRTIFAASPGTLSRLDGVVPAVKERIDWQQGLAVLANDGLRTSCQIIPIDEGIAYIYGDRLVGKDPGVDIARDTGWPQLA